MAITTRFTCTASENYPIGSGSSDYEKYTFTLTGTAIPTGAQVTSAVLRFSNVRAYSRTIKAEVDGTRASADYTPGWYQDSGPMNMQMYVLPSYVGRDSIPVRVWFVSNGQLSGNGEAINVRGGSTITLEVTYNMHSTGTLNKERVEAGQTITLNITPASPSFTHDAVWEFGIHSQRNHINGTSDTFTVPLEWLDTIPNTTSLGGRVVLQTFSDGIKLGEVNYLYTVTVPDSAVPTAGSLSVTGTNLFNGMYLQGISTANASLTGSAGACCSTIVSTVYSGTGLQNTAGTITITGTVTDSRGRTDSTSVPITVYAYSAPKIVNPVVFRCDGSGNASDTGTYISVTATGGVTVLYGNNMYMRVATKKSTESVYGAAVPIASGVTEILSGYETVASYDVQVTVSDEVGNGATYVVQVSSAGYLMYIRKDGKGAAFGKACEHENSFELPEGWTIRIGDSGIANNRNLLDNWDFRNPVNQRGGTAYTGEDYAIDRWVMKWNGDGIIGIQPDYLNLSRPVYAAHLEQRIENPNRLAGETVTCTLLARGSLGGFGLYLENMECLYGTNPQELGENWAYVHFTVTLPTSMNFLSFHFNSIETYTEAASILQVRAAKMEIGKISTLANDAPADFGTELMKCQRFYQVRSTNNILPMDMRPMMAGTVSVTPVTGGYVYRCDL